MRPSRRLERIPPYLFAELERKITAKRAAGVDVISLGIGDPDTPTYEPIVEHDAFPNRTNVSWFTELEPGRIRARIFERGAGQTTASGTGATGAAVAYVLEGGESPVTVVLDGGELEVEVGEDLGIKLSGPALPVFRGSLSPEVVAELQ